MLVVKYQYIFLNHSWCLGWITFAGFMQTGHKKHRIEILFYWVFYWVNLKGQNNLPSQFIRCWQTFFSCHLKVTFRINAKEKTSRTAFPNVALIKVYLNWIENFLIVWHIILPCISTDINIRSINSKPLSAWRQHGGQPKAVDGHGCTLYEDNAIINTSQKSSRRLSCPYASCQGMLCELFPSSRAFIAHPCF